MAERVWRRQDDHGGARPVNIVETGNDSWRFKSHDEDHVTRSFREGLQARLCPIDPIPECAKLALTDRSLDGGLQL
jgi:hypothetical protein